MAHDKRKYLGSFLISLPISLFVYSVTLAPVYSGFGAEYSGLLWKHQCIDTMKFSRDRAREWATRNDLQDIIDGQMRKIRDMGANCVAIGTPYDEEFVSYLTKWVIGARRYGLHVWYRGNLSGWEGWFGYPKITEPEIHHRQIDTFINLHPDLFAEGDIFTPAPEPENGGPGDPRTTGRRSEFLRFLTDSYATCSAAFSSINKSVTCGYFSMNGDVARDILDKETVKNTGNVIVIDHYVREADKMAADIRLLALKYDSSVMVGEMGAPIPDVNGPMSEHEQAIFLESILSAIFHEGPNVIGVNYWVLTGGTTALFNDDGTEREAASVVRKFFRPGLVTGTVKNTLGDVLKLVTIDSDRTLNVSLDGNYNLVLPQGMQKIEYKSAGYRSTVSEINVREFGSTQADIILLPEKTSLIYGLRTAVNMLIEQSVSWFRRISR